MSKRESDASNQAGANRTQEERGGAFGEDRSKEMDNEQSDNPFGKQREESAGRNKKDSRE